MKKLLFYYYNYYNNYYSPVGSLGNTAETNSFLTSNVCINVDKKRSRVKRLSLEIEKQPHNELLSQIEG